MAKTLKQVNKISNQKFRENNKDYFKKYYQKNKKQFKKYSKEYYNKNRNEILTQEKNYRQEHKEERNVYIKLKRKNNINFKLADNLRNRIRKALRNENKSKFTLKLLGCSIQKLKSCLEEQFKLGMTWKNYGKWHIDHIKSCVSFDLSQANEQKKCFNYTNLQPLWAEENLSKGGNNE